MTEALHSPSRRDLFKTAGGAAVAATLLGSVPVLHGAPASPAAAGSGKKLRYALIGTGIRAHRMWGAPVAKDFADVVEFVGLCDINPKRVEVARELYGL